MPKACVLISTFNRVQVLLRCLKYLEAQTYKDFDVLIMDDGSSDGTREEVERYRESAAYPIHYLWQPNAGQATARNTAIRACGAELAIQLGDDMFLSPTYVETHVNFHTQHPEENVISIGLTEWSRDGQKVTKLMEWLNYEGIQFAFGSLLKGRKPSWNDLYGSGMAFKTSYLKANPYMESFGAYGWEDLELGVRLQRDHGMDLHFLPEAVAYHLHPVDYMGSCRRMHSVGASAYKFKQIWPEFQEYPPLSPGKQRIFELITQPTFLRILSHFTSALTRVWCPNPLTRTVLKLHGRAGFAMSSRASRQTQQQSALQRIS